jgi:4-amino-4-deoxy-L-arabinose transferase-like glycosyltransferase
MIAANQNKKTARPLDKIPLPELIAVLGAILYIVQAVIFTHIHLPNFDEGSYLFKGYLFARGVYRPFQPYGFWVNKMPLAFFIWGWIQEWFKPGLLAPRYFAVLFSALSLLGTWIVARRMGSRWLAAIAVWVLALNPTIISYYSIANSQVLIICMLVWVLVLCLGAQRPTWQIFASGILAGIMTMTRENMVFVLPFLILYIFWQHGRKKGLLALLAAIIVLVIGHIIYWPDILNLWERWIPHGLFSFHKQTSVPVAVGEGSEITDLSLPARFYSLSLAVRIYFIPFVGSIIVLFLWPKKDAWQTRDHYRAALFLAATFFVLLISHAWASLGHNYCIYCLTSYFAFWGNVGLLLVVTSISALNKTPSLLLKAATITILLVVCSAIGYSWFEQIGAGLLTNISVPRIQGGHIFQGSATLWEILNNKFQIAFADARRYAPAVAGLASGIILIILFRIFYRRYSQRMKLSFASFSGYAFLLLGFVLSPLLAWPMTVPLCRNNVITIYQKIGLQFASIAPPGTKIYLDGLITTIPLLYAPDVIVLPPQINGVFSFQSDGDPDTLLKYGFWNQQIADQWHDAADVFVIGQDAFLERPRYFNPDVFEMVQLTSRLKLCPLESRLYIFKRK